MYPLVRELAGDGVPVTVTCRVLKLARQPYYRWLAIADREEGRPTTAPPASRSEDAEVRELRRRNRQLEPENEILRRATAYFARDVLPK